MPKHDRAGRPTITDPADIEARCSVAGTTECDIRDLVFLQRAIAAMPPPENVETRCDAALSPPTRHRDHELVMDPLLRTV